MVGEGLSRQHILTGLPLNIARHANSPAIRGKQRHEAQIRLREVAEKGNSIACNRTNVLDTQAYISKRHAYDNPLFRK